MLNELDYDAPDVTGGGLLPVIDMTALRERLDRSLGIDPTRCRWCGGTPVVDYFVARPEDGGREIPMCGTCIAAAEARIAAAAGK